MNVHLHVFDKCRSLPSNLHTNVIVMHPHLALSSSIIFSLQPTAVEQLAGCTAASLAPEICALLLAHEEVFGRHITAEKNSSSLFTGYAHVGDETPKPKQKVTDIIVEPLLKLATELPQSMRMGFGIGTGGVPMTPT